MFEGFQVGNHAAIHPNIRKSVFAIALLQKDSGANTAFQKLLAFVRDTQSTEVARDALMALGYAQNEQDMVILLDLLLTDKIQISDFYLPMLDMRETAVGAERLWHWAQQNWNAIESKFSESLGIFGVIVGIMVRGRASEKGLLEVHQFFAAKDTSKFAKQLAQVMDSMEIIISWAKREGVRLHEWLKTELHQRGRD